MLSIADAKRGSHVWKVEGSISSTLPYISVSLISHGRYRASDMLHYNLILFSNNLNDSVRRMFMVTLFIDKLADKRLESKLTESDSEKLIFLFAHI